MTSFLKRYLPTAQLALMLGAAALMFSFVRVAREGEMRRRCSAICALKPAYAGHDRPAPDFTLKDMRGHNVSLSDYRGRVVVLNFWTKTCGPCLDEMPAIAELAKVLRSHGDAVVLSVSTDEGPEAVRGTLLSVLGEPPPFSVLFDPDSKVVGEKFGTKLFPETYVIDPKGFIRARFDGARDWTSATVVQWVEQLQAGVACDVSINDARATGSDAAVCEGW